MDNQMLIIATVFVVALTGFRIFKTLRVFIGGGISLYALFEFFQYIINLS